MRRGEPLIGRNFRAFDPPMLKRKLFIFHDNVFLIQAIGSQDDMLIQSMRPCFYYINLLRQCFSWFKGCIIWLLIWSTSASHQTVEGILCLDDAEFGEWKRVLRHPITLLDVSISFKSKCIQIQIFMLINQCRTFNKVLSHTRWIRSRQQNKWNVMVLLPKSVIDTARR